MHDTRSLTIVADVMHLAVITVRQTALASEVLQTMQRLGLHSVIVEPLRPGQMYGIFSNREAAARLAVPGADAGLTVHDVMVTPRLYAAPGMRLEDCATLLLAANTRLTIVIDQGKPVGIISDSDIFQAIEARGQG